VLLDERDGQEAHLCYEGGIRLRRIPEHQQDPILNPRCSISSCHKSPATNGIGVEVAMQWNDAYQEGVYCFTNNIPQRDGGTHLGLPHRADPHAEQLHGQRRPASRKAKSAASGDDMREGLTAIISVKVPDPKFSSQTKDKLVSSEVTNVVAVEQAMNEKLGIPAGKPGRRQDHCGQDH
jgi:DNA gyrase subunit B